MVLEPYDTCMENEMIIFFQKIYRLPTFRYRTIKIYTMNKCYLLLHQRKELITYYPINSITWEKPLDYKFQHLTHKYKFISDISMFLSLSQNTWSFDLPDFDRLILVHFYYSVNRWANFNIDDISKCVNR